MTKVTNLKYHLNHYLKDLLDLCYERQKKKWDNLIIIDGVERSGKTTLAILIAYYYAHISKLKFGIENIFFDPEKLLDFATQTQNNIMIWDEAAFGGMAQEWHTRVQKILCKMLMTTGKYGHFYIFIIPNFFRLKDYLAVDRSLALIHVYSPDLINRGYFICLNELQKKWVYNQNKKSMTYGKNFSFNGRFVHQITSKMIDLNEYEKRKDQAIQYELNKAKDRTHQKLIRLQYNIASMLPPKKAIEVGDISIHTLKHWLNRGKSLEKNGF